MNTRTQNEEIRRLRLEVAVAKNAMGDALNYWMALQHQWDDKKRELEYATFDRSTIVMEAAAEASAEVAKWSARLKFMDDNACDRVSPRNTGVQANMTRDDVLKQLIKALATKEADCAKAATYKMDLQKARDAYAAHLKTPRPSGEPNKSDHVAYAKVLAAAQVLDAAVTKCNSKEIEMAARQAERSAKKKTKQPQKTQETKKPQNKRVKREN
jgi:hypothetical protein